MVGQLVMSTTSAAISDPTDVISWRLRRTRVRRSTPAVICSVRSVAVRRDACADARSPSTRLESSGGLSLDTAAEYAGTGVDYLAVGALTHSVRVLDVGLDI